MLETDNATPYYLNLHEREVAHTLVLGATGSGKSFFANFLLQNAQKYKPLTYIFDIGGSFRSPIITNNEDSYEISLGFFAVQQKYFVSRALRPRRFWHADSRSLEAGRSRAGTAERDDIFGFVASSLLEGKDTVPLRPSFC